MSSNTSASPEPAQPAAPTTKARATRKPAVVKKPTVAKAKTAPKSKTTTTKSTKAKPATSSHPSWKDIVAECIADNKEDARQGVSRSTIKKYAEDKYHLEPTAGNTYQLNRAITTGAESGIFALPKGPSGKIKLAPKTKSAGGAKEVSLLVRALS
ncbi:hypothetical protein FPV67DRAFT_283769 [Lyophyllum atratum]|nr:hypothetical protein FPV67DRAFT_283769 [Lyophyllum atratum]